jgi:hypothetical protein
MSRKRLAAFYALMLFGLAACNGNAPYTAPNTASQPPQPVALTSTGASIGTNSVPGITTNIVVAGSGSVTGTESLTLPAGIPALQLARAGSATTQSRAHTDDVIGTPIIFFTLTATSATSITGVGQFAVTFIAPPTAPVYLGFYNGTSWNAIATATISGNTVSSGALSFNPPVTVAAGASVVFALYNGSDATNPNPTPTPHASTTPTASPAPSTPTPVPPTPIPTLPPTPIPTLPPTPIPTLPPTPTPTLPPAGALGASPTTLTLNGTGAATFTVLESGYVGNFTVTSDNLSVITIDASPVTATGSSTTVNIHALAAGTANITVTDSTSQQVVVPVGVTTTPITIQGRRGGAR